MGRLIYAIAASAALSVQAVASLALAAPRAEVEGEIDADLRAAVVTAIGETDRPIQNRFEARRRARAAAEDAIAVLRSEGYYAYVVEPDVGEGDAPIVRIVPGPRFAIAAPTIAWVGDEPEAATSAAAQAALGLEPGRPGRAADVVGAEGRAVSAIQKRGYADAAAEPREVIVDHADDTVRPTFRLAAGPIVRLNGIDLTTDGRTRRAWLDRLVPWTPGDPYDPDDVAELERRLLDAGVYESVTVALAPAENTTPEGLRPVVVSLAERKRRTIELGGSYATEEGFGVDARWTRYNVLGRADTLALLARLSDLDTRTTATLTLPHWRRPQQTLTTGAAAYRVRTDAYDETGVGVRADVQRRYGKTSYITVGASLDVSQTEELREATLMPLGRDLITLGTLADMSLDRSDDILNPRRGWRLSARVEPTMLFGDSQLGFLRVQTQGSAYYPFGAQARTVVAGRVRLGSILNGGIPAIPASRRFYAGGGGSVRGFSYQAVGPRLSDDTPQGGVSLLEVSAEVRRDLTPRWGVVAFVDGGAVGTDQFPGPSNLSIGAGLGIRYNLGFGPIRLDIATPVTKRSGEAPFQIYVSIGQSF